MDSHIQIKDFTVHKLIYASKRTKVYSAKNRQTSEDVVLKILDKKYPTPLELESFKQEYEIGRTLIGDGVVKTLEMRHHENSLMIVFEDFKGMPVKNILHKGELSLLDFLKFGIRVSEILGEIHQANVIHKDINPSNILWNRSTGELKIIDFGISSQLSREITDVLKPEALDGSLSYISPEQTGRMNRSIDYRTDLYSLGITFYELITGRLPFNGDDPIELVHSHLAKIPDPAHQVKAGLPQIVSDMIMKLIEKNPEERYQSANGLKYDLQLCLKAVSENAGVIFPFTLSSRDFSEKFQIPQKLYGKDKEISILMDAFDDASSGKNEFVLIAGPSGMGKSSLVNELYKPIVKKNGYFIKGKFDQFMKDIPYSAISQAFKELIKEIQSESDAKIAKWKADFLEALGPNGQLIIDIIPELEQIIGHQANPADLNPAESQHRFIMIFRNFIKKIANSDHTLVLFVDDIQWIDEPSLSLLKDLTTKDVPYFMLIVSYRDNELFYGHPFEMALDEIGKLRSFKNIQTEALSQIHVRQLVSDTLHQSMDEVDSLSEIIYKKTKGNPFFTSELLKNLHKEKYIQFNHSSGKWEWELKKIKAINISENVLEFMLDRFKKLPDDCVTALKLASCIGNRFDLKTLSVIMQMNPSAVSEILLTAVQEDIIFVHGNRYKINSLDENTDLNISYRFQHDRIQQVANSLIEDSQKEQVHLQIGRLILDKSPENVQNERLIEITNHLNIGHRLIKDADEKHRLVELNLKAGEKSMASTAYSSAFVFFEIGITLLPPDSWERQYKRTFGLYKGLSLCAYQIGKQDIAEKKLDLLIQNARTNLDKVEIISMRTKQYTTVGKLTEAIAEGVKGLALLGVKISDKPGPPTVLYELVKSKIALRNKKIPDLINEPLCQDPEKMMIARLLTEMGAPAYTLGNDNLYGLIVLKIVNLSLKYGNTPESACAYVAYGMLVSILLGDFKSGYEFGKLSIDLNEKLNDLEYRCRIIAAYGVLTHHWNFHWSSLSDWFQKAIEAGIHTGDQFFLCHSAFHCVIWNPKLNIETQIELHQKNLNLLYDIGYEDATVDAEIQLQVFRNLRGETLNRETLSSKDFDEDAKYSRIKERKNITGLAIFHIAKAEINLYFGHVEDAYLHVKEADKNINSLIGLPFMVKFSAISFHVASAYLTQGALSPQIKNELIKRMNAEYRKMKKWAKYKPSNFLHHLQAFEAELFRHKKKFLKAASFYSQAIESAKNNEWLKDEAFANELAGRFYISVAQPKAAWGFIEEAHYLYLRLGASEKAKFLEETFPELQKRDHKVESFGQISSSITSTSKKGGNSLDMLTIAKASQTISGEIVLETLLKKMMRITVENAGAQRGVLLLVEYANLIVQAELRIENDEVIVLQGIPQKDYHNIPQSAINYVANSKLSVVLADARHEGHFTQDPYILSNGTKSIFIEPIIRQNVLQGILFLENNLTTGAFSPQRQELLNVISTQIAISIENSKLYENLEEKVKERTVELKLANEKLNQTNEELQSTVEVVNENSQMLQYQKDEIEKSHKHITDSINYAKRIQNAILPKQNIEIPFIKDHFILFKPRDIISGDFYFIKKVRNKSYIAAVDCTGHGVPGAFMSMLGIAFLNDLLNRPDINEPADVLNELREQIKLSLQQTGQIGEQQDGMDIAFCAIDNDTLEMTFAGAHNPILIYRQGAEGKTVDLIEIKGEHQPIGIYIKEKPFTQKSFQLQTGDTFYLFSDGYHSQFGGKRNAPLKSKYFKNLLAEISQLPCEDQKQILENKFNDWMHTNDQTDDVLVMGIKM